MYSQFCSHLHNTGLVSIQQRCKDYLQKLATVLSERGRGEPKTCRTRELLSCLGRKKGTTAFFLWEHTWIWRALMAVQKKGFLSMGTAPNKRQYHLVAQCMQDEHSIKKQQRTICCSHSPITPFFKKRVCRFPCCTCKLRSHIPSHLKGETYTSLRNRLKAAGKKQRLALVRSVMYQATASQQEDGEWLYKLVAVQSKAS